MLLNLNNWKSGISLRVNEYDGCGQYQRVLSLAYRQVTEIAEAGRDKIDWLVLNHIQFHNPDRRIQREKARIIRALEQLFGRGTAGIYNYDGRPWPSRQLIGVRGMATEGHSTSCGACYSQMQVMTDRTIGI